MGDADITASSWRMVEVGRVALISTGHHAGKLAAIVQIIDHKRVRLLHNQHCREVHKAVAQHFWELLKGLHTHPQVLIDGPSSGKENEVPRHAASLSYMSLTGIVIPKLPRGIGRAALKKKWDEYEVESKWNSTSFAKSRERSIRRRKLSDFERFKVMRLRKQVCRLPIIRRGSSLGREGDNGGRLYSTDSVLCKFADYD